MPTSYQLANGDYSQDWSSAAPTGDMAAYPNVAVYGIDNNANSVSHPNSFFTDFTTAAVFGTTSNGNPSAGGAYNYTNGADRTFAFQGSGGQDYIALVFFLDATGRQNITFKADYRDLDAGADNAQQEIQVQYRIGGTGDWANADNGYISDATIGGSTQTTTLTASLPSAANGAANLQIRVMTANASGNDELVGVDNIVIHSDPSGTTTPQPGTFSIADAQVTEGDTGTTPLTFTVSRAGGSAGAADISYAAAFAAGAGHADASDFSGATSGTVHFADGQTSAQITLNVAGDTVNEGTETFSLTLSNPTAGSLGTATATGTIIDNDAPPVGVLSIAGASVTEGDTGTTPISFTVTRANGSAGAIDANYAVNFNGTANASDLTGATSGTVHFNDGQTSATITLNVAGDTTFEQNETFSVTLSNPTGGATLGTATATGTIVNDDPAPPTAPLFINELHYDNIGTDSGEAIEIAGPAGTSLAGWQLVLYNGDGGAVYSTTNLSGTIADQNNGYGTISVPYGVNGIQNGSPDGIALVAPDGSVVQFLSYEGVMTAVGGPANGLTSTDIGVAETSGPVGQSLQLTGTGATYADFTWANDQQNTFGGVNTGQSFLPANGTGFFRVNDPTVTEGDSGTHQLVFTITRSGGSAAAASVHYDVALDGTADQNDVSGSLPSGTLNFAVGETIKTVAVTVLGDTQPEPNETLSLHLSNATGNSQISDDTGVGTIVNDDPVTLAIYTIQGAAQTSAYVGQKVTTTGIVTAVGNSGFYIQDAVGDGDSRTSDAIFVATAAKSSLAVGDSVTVSGTIAEAGSSGDLSVTEFANGSSTYVVNSHNNALPAAVVIGTDGILPPTQVIDNDHLTSYDPTTDGIDFYESLEGMRITVETPLVVARTDSAATWVVASDGVGATGVNAEGGITISAGDYNPERIQLHSSTDIYGGFTGTYSQDDLLNNVTGVLNYTGGNYRLEVTNISSTTPIRDANLQPETTTITGDATHLTVASFNMENADPGDPQVKFDLIGQTIVNNLKAPDIVLAQEIQDADGAGTGNNLSGAATAQKVIDAISAASNGTLHYAYVEVAPTTHGDTGGEPDGNIRNGIFYNVDAVSYVADSAHLITGAAYDGSRKPLVADFTFNGQTVTMIDMHSTSRLGSDDLYGSYQPPLDAGDGARTAQADTVKAYIDNVLANDPTHNFVVGGDFNGFYFEQALQDLGSNGVTNLNSLIPAEERYSYLFDGNLQQIDNILVSNNLLAGAAFDAVHINTLKPVGADMATDHDQVIGSIVVAAANHAPVGVADAVAVNEDATTSNLYATLLGNDTDQDPGTTLNITGVNTTGTLGQVVFDAASHSLQYVANNDAFDQLPTGATATDSFTYTVSDGTATSTATVTVTVTGIADGSTFTGGSANDVNPGTTGDDKLYGNAGNDELHGGAGADFLSGGLGNDNLFGDAGRDTLLGGAGNDNLTGGDGDDYLSGDAGNDVLTGGAGADTFAFGSNGGRDTINDFDTTLDHILLTSNVTLVSSTVGDINRDGVADLLLTFSGGSSAVVLGVSDVSTIHIDHIAGPLITEPTF